MSFARATAFANAEAECPNRINRVLAVVHYFCVTIDFSNVLTIIIHDNKHIPKII